MIESPDDLEEQLEYPEGMDENKSFSDRADSFIKALPKFLEEVNETSKAAYK